MKVKAPKKMRCNGNSINVYDIKNSKSLVKSYFNESVLFLSDRKPIAIKYQNGLNVPIMTFKNYGETSVKDKIELRKVDMYVTVLEKDFNDALSMLFSEL